MGKVVEESIMRIETERLGDGKQRTMECEIVKELETSGASMSEQSMERIYS